MKKQLKEQAVNNDKFARTITQSYAMMLTVLSPDKEMCETNRAHKAKEQQKLLDDLNLINYAVREFLIFF